jgi:hypothetical protein
MEKTNADSDKAILLTPKGTLTIGEEYSSPSISFYKNDEVEDVVTIHYSKFKYKGEEVKDLQTIYDIIKSLTSIELPSDEEIEKRAEVLYPINKGGSMFMPSRDDINKANKQEGFKGAEWMKEQIGKEDKTFKQKSKWTEVDNTTRRLK